MLSKAFVEVLDELRERSDGTHEKESVDSEEFSIRVLREMALQGLVQLTGDGPGPREAWITPKGCSELLSHDATRPSDDWVPEGLRSGPDDQGRPW